MKLTETNKETLARALVFYYVNHVWGTMLKQDAGEASDEDYRLREIIEVLELRKYIPEGIKMKF